MNCKTYNEFDRVKCTGKLIPRCYSRISLACKGDFIKNYIEMKSDVNKFVKKLKKEYSFDIK